MSNREADASYFLIIPYLALQYPEETSDFSISIDEYTIHINFQDIGCNLDMGVVRSLGVDLRVDS